MNTTFSIHRILLLLKADWIEHKKSFLFSMGVLLIVWLFIIFVGELSPKDITPQAAIFVFGGLITFTYYCRHVGRKIHKSPNLYLTIPASTPEKYATLLLEGLIYFLTYICLFYFGILLWKLTVPKGLIMSLKDVFMHNGNESGLFFLTALIFLSYLTFRKHAFLIAIGGIVAYIGIIGGILVKLTIRAADHYQMYFESSFLHDTVQFLSDFYMPAMLIATVVVMYVGYLKLKEKELR